MSKDPRLADFFIKEIHGKKEFVLLRALLRLVNSSDDVVVRKSYECLLICASLQHSSVTLALTTGYLPAIVGSKLQYHFQLIPPNAKFSAILSCKTVSRCNCSTTGDTGIGYVHAFFNWLSYCDQIITASQESLGNALCENIHEIFLSASLLPKLLKNKEEEILISTSVLARAIQLLKCGTLLKEFVLFILDDSFNAEKTFSASILDKLICRINHNNEDVCQVTLQLFNVLLQSPRNSAIIEALSGRQQGIRHCIIPNELMCSARLQLEKDIFSYLSLIPAFNSSIESDYEENFSPYLREAHKDVARMHDLCKASVIVDSSSHKSDGGVFFDALLCKLEAVLDQPYEINLLVASLFTQIAMAPYPTFEWLFETGTQEQNVYTVLKKVTRTFQLRVERTPGLMFHIVEARRRLEGLPTSDLLSMPHNTLLEGAIVIEEFIKELCAIIYVRTSWSILCLPE